MKVWIVEGTANASWKCKPEELAGKLREVEIVLSRGGTTVEAWSRIAISGQTCCC